MSTTAGRRTLERIPVATIANGHELELVVHTIEGDEAGPRLGLIAGIHGDEPLGVETVRRFVEELESFRGTLVVLPVANPYAFQALSRNTTLDMNNLNRVFPGTRDGMFTEQLAAVIVETLLPRIDYLMDFHSGGTLPTVDYAYLHDTNGLAEAYGSEILFQGPSFEGSLGDYARKHGVPTVVSELGGGQALNEHYIEKGLRGIRNVMTKLGMLDGEVVVPEKQVIVDELIVLRPHAGGLMLCSFDPGRLGESVPKGTELARTVSPYTFETLEVFTAPFDPTLLVLVRDAVSKVDAGDYGLMVANGATARPVS